MELASKYQPSQLEPTIYAMWEKSGVFNPSGEGEPYSIVMPPPNANGNLHIGHALTVSLQDLLARYYRMKGRDVAYIPGADHAGFETWVVFEKHLAKQGRGRHEFSRDQLYQMVWDFVAKERGNMELQLRALGVSCSWNDLVFTLDEKVIKGVYQTFKKLWDDGLVYRGERIVNYSTKYQTSYADIEVDNKEVEGVLYKIAYPILDEVGELVVATTRPETMFGDVAIAVNPEDDRYKKFIGKEVILPLTNREIPVIADEYVDPEYGTGVLKITPAHDPNDFELGQKYQFEPIKVIDFDGTMINVPAGFVGLTVDEARKKTIAALEAQELLRGSETIKHVVGFDYKSGLPIEPMIKDQWFLKVRPLAERAKQALVDGQIKFYPESKKRVLIQYLDNLRDWNLSRQIAWGIPIPAFQNSENCDDWIFDDRVDQKELEINGKIYYREEDTFDTWFSSGQWPFLTTDYLENGKLARFYPNNLMETGADLLDRWVARMIMLGLYMTDKVPFEEVYMHGMVLDSNSQKMSKSKGNVVNPMEIIGEYGSDALRIGVISNRSAGQNQAFSTSSVVAGRNFCNKLWNMARFAQSKIDDNFKVEYLDGVTAVSEADNWILIRLNQAIKQVEDNLANYRFAEAMETIYHFLWSNVADWYVESAKTNLNPQLLAYVLESCLKLAHPFAPFTTEAIWQSLPWREDLLIKQSFPESNQIVVDSTKANAFDDIIKIVEETRYLNASLPGYKKYDLIYVSDELIANNRKLIKHLANLKDVIQQDNPVGIRIANTAHNCWLKVDAETLYRHQSDLEVRLLETRAQAAKLAQRLENQAYLAKAPAKLVDESRSQLKQTEELIARLEKELEVLE